MLFFADRGERAKAQAMLIGSVTAVIAPCFSSSSSSTTHTATASEASSRGDGAALGILDDERRLSDETGAAPCDATAPAIWSGFVTIS